MKGVWERSGRSGRGAKVFSTSWLQSDASLYLQQCPQTSMATAAGVVPASSRGSLLPRMLLLPWSRGGSRGVPVRAERSKWVLVLLPSKPSEAASQSICCYRYVWKQLSRNLGIGQAENQVRSSSCAAPAAVPRKRALICQFYCVFLFSTCNNRSWFIAVELLLLNWV